MSVAAEHTHFDFKRADAIARRADEPGPLTHGERHKLLVEWNQTAREYARQVCIHQLFEEQVERSPDAVALIFADEELTYRQLNARANRLAEQLRGLEVGPEVLVGVYLERSVAMVVGLLGILKAGGAYVPMDPKYPRERVAFILADAQPQVILTQASLRQELPVHRAAMVIVDDPGDAAVISTAKPGSENQRPHAGNLAYVIYTSGSTGKPKGVAIEHRNAVNFIHWGREVFSDAEMAGVLAGTSICFDLSIFELFVTLSCGGKVILAESVLQLPHLPARDQVTLINTVPSAMAELVNVGGVPQNVQVVNLAGEPLATALVEKIYAVKNLKKVNDLYGPTETTTYSTFTLRRRGLKPTIGRPLANTTVYLLDGSLAPVPVGEAGELYIGGAGVARGYLHRPELTAEKFIADPFSSVPGARLYRTGDLARYQADGVIEYLGRMDQQIKLRGFRIELGEIEAVLGGHPQVQESVVVAREDAGGGKYLAAYLVVREDAVPSLPELRRFLKEKLPDYMVPAAFMKLAALLLTPNGKVDRQALPPPERDSMALGDYVAPRPGLESKVAEIWKQVLELPQVGSQDSFFDLGGQSLLAVRLIAEINRVLNVNLDVLTLFEHPTIAALVAALPDIKPALSGSRLVPLEAGGSGPPIFFFTTPMEVFRLAKMARQNQPVYLSESPFSSELLTASVQHNHAAFPSVAEMAAPHTAMIVASGLSGPFVLAGYSDGGVLAFEVAHQLKTHGIQVETVFLFDSNMMMPKWGRLKRHLWNSFRSGPSYVWGKIREQLTEIEAGRLARRSAAPSPVTSDPALGSPGPEVWESVHRIWLHAMRRYHPRPLASRGILLRAEKSIYTEVHDYDGCLGWQGLFAGGLEIIEVPGDHSSMWKEPQLRTLGKIWGECLGQIRRVQNVFLSMGFNLFFCGAANGI